MAVHSSCSEPTPSLDENVCAASSQLPLSIFHSLSSMPMPIRPTLPQSSSANSPPLYPVSTLTTGSVSVSDVSDVSFASDRKGGAKDNPGAAVLSTSPDAILRPAVKTFSKENRLLAQKQALTPHHIT